MVQSLCGEECPRLPERTAGVARVADVQRSPRRRRVRGEDEPDSPVLGESALQVGTVAVRNQDPYCSVGVAGLPVGPHAGAQSGIGKALTREVDRLYLGLPVAGWIRGNHIPADEQGTQNG